MNGHTYCCTDKQNAHILSLSLSPSHRHAQKVNMQTLKDSEAVSSDDSVFYSFETYINKGTYD